MRKIGARKYSEEEERKIVEEYLNGVPVNVLLARYGYKTKKSIFDKVAKYYTGNNDPSVIAKNARKPYALSLEKIDTRFNAYFVGLMLTDGYICSTNKFGIDLTDEDCIAFLSESTGQKYATYPGPNSGNKERHRIVFYDSEAVKALERFGCVPKKSLILPTPQLCEEEYRFLPYLIRGIIDGDGSTTPTSYGAPQFLITTASEEFAQWIKTVLENRMYMNDVQIYTSVNSCGTTMYDIGSALKQNIQILLALSYNEPYGMARKYNQLNQTFRDYNGDIL